ncbi:hypothetical protein N9977_00010 [bacterium]|nr:hypothetical protein [bacterium]
MVRDPQHKNQGTKNPAHGPGSMVQGAGIMAQYKWTKSQRPPPVDLTIFYLFNYDVDARIKTVTLKAINTLSARTIICFG